MSFAHAPVDSSDGGTGIALFTGSGVWPDGTGGGVAARDGGGEEGRTSRGGAAAGGGMRAAGVAGIVGSAGFAVAPGGVAGSDASLVGSGVLPLGGGALGAGFADGDGIGGSPVCVVAGTGSFGASFGREPTWQSNAAPRPA